jgi:hypothetical protein
VVGVIAVVESEYTGGRARSHEGAMKGNVRAGRLVVNGDDHCGDDG